MPGDIELIVSAINSQIRFALLVSHSDDDTEMNVNARRDFLQKSLILSQSTTNLEILTLVSDPGHVHI